VLDWSYAEEGPACSSSEATSIPQCAWQSKHSWTNEPAMLVYTVTTTARSYQRSSPDRKKKKLWKMVFFKARTRTTVSIEICVPGRQSWFYMVDQEPATCGERALYLAHLPPYAQHLIYS
jgi:hypothetical protein